MKIEIDNGKAIIGIGLICVSIALIMVFFKVTPKDPPKDPLEKAFYQTTIDVEWVRLMMKNGKIVLEDERYAYIDKWIWDPLEDDKKAQLAEGIANYFANFGGDAFCRIYDMHSIKMGEMKQIGQYIGGSYTERWND